MTILFGFGVKKKRAARGRRSGNHYGRHKRTSRVSGNAAAFSEEESRGGDLFSLFIRL
jgi:hypothetical protein